MTKSKVAVITAASKGIGAACAKELAVQGYHVAIMARSPEVLALGKELGGFGIAGSVTEKTDLEKLITFTMDQYGRIDALVNNTGHPPKGDLLSLSDEDWYSGLDLLLLSVIRSTRLVTPIMLEQGQGAIVNISTFGAVEPSLDFPISSAIRAGLSSFTKMYAERYAPNNIRMNNLLPGFIDSYPVGESTRTNIPMGRSGSVREIAQTVVFLLSDAAGYITGQNIRVDGGLTRSL